MSKEQENRSTFTIYEKTSIGEVQIADEVVAIIAGLAATEVEGVSAMNGNIQNEIVGKLGKKNLAKGVKVVVAEDTVSVDMALTLEYGYGVAETAKTVQEKVKQAIELMTGLKVEQVNIRIAGVSIDKTK